MRFIRRNRGAALGVALFTAVALGLTMLIANALTQSAGPPRVEYVAEFTDASGVRIGDEVRIAGVRVGRVEGRELHDGVARITFSIAETQPVRTDTIVRISYLNVLGQRYLTLEPGDAPGEQLSPGTVIGVDNTRPALDLTALFNAFKPMFDALDPASVNVLAEFIIESLQGQGPTLDHLIGETAELTARLAGHDELLGRVIDNVTLVLSVTHEHSDTLRSVVSGLDSLVAELAADADTLAASIEAVDRLTTAADALLDATADPFLTTMATMRPIGVELIRELGALNDAIVFAPIMLDAYARAMSYGSYLNIHICNLSIGLEDQILLPGDAGFYSAVCAR